MIVWAVVVLIVLFTIRAIIKLGQVKKEDWDNIDIDHKNEEEET